MSTFPALISWILNVESFVWILVLTSMWLIISAWLGRVQDFLFTNFLTIRIRESTYRELKLFEQSVMVAGSCIGRSAVFHLKTVVYVHRKVNRETSTGGSDAERVRLKLEVEVEVGPLRSFVMQWFSGCFPFPCLIFYDHRERKGAWFSWWPGTGRIIIFRWRSPIFLQAIEYDNVAAVLRVRGKNLSENEYVRVIWQLLLNSEGFNWHSSDSVSCMWRKVYAGTLSRSHLFRA